MSRPGGGGALRRGPSPFPSGGLRLTIEAGETVNELHPNGRALRPASFLCLAFLPLVLAFSLQRLVLQARITAYQPAPGAVLLDAGLALGVVLAALLLARLHWAPAALFLAAAALLQAADTEMVIAMDTVISPADLRQGLDGHFLQGSLSRLAAPVYAALTLGGAALAAAALARARRRGGLPPARVTAPLLAAAAAALFLLTPREGGWESASPLLLTLTRPPEAPRPLPAGERAAAAAPAAGLAEGEPAAAAAAPPAGGPPAPLPAAFLPSSPAEGEPLVRRAPGAGRNVLLVVLEGIPGAYLRQVQEATGVAYPIVMPALSRIAGRSLLVPRFLAHNRQTIRGLYSLLSGDYPGLSLLTPKIYEYMRLPPESRRPCLPEILSEAGYETVFLQAADLAYMSKDQFLPRAGFRRVLGREHFASRGGPSGWGPDDRAFFEEAARLVVELDRGEAPWFLTLLTVGTHHPYAVPDEWAARWPTRKEAAVAWLDAALEAFWARLEGEGILEDTLVVITSDESHGVTGHPFGRFWGLALAVAPEGAGVVRDGGSGCRGGGRGRRRRGPAPPARGLRPGRSPPLGARLPGPGRAHPGARPPQPVPPAGDRPPAALRAVRLPGGRDGGGGRGRGAGAHLGAGRRRPRGRAVRPGLQPGAA